MVITIKRGGGLANLKDEIAVDTKRLDPEAAKMIEGTIKRLNLAGLSGDLPSTQVGADFLTYEVTLDQEGRRNSFRVLDDGGDFAKKNTRPRRRDPSFIQRCLAGAKRTIAIQGGHSLASPGHTVWAPQTPCHRRYVMSQ